jgi:hypothetical protein
MIRHTGTIAVVATLLAACAESAPTGPQPRNLAPSFQREIGVPGTANCRGQTTAFVAQAAKNAGVEGFRGFAGLARAAELSVQELHAAVEAFCNPPAP